MALKMSSAVTSDGRQFVADEVGILAEIPSLICASCGAGVAYVPPHARENRGNTYWVRGYFRLLPRLAHEQSCAFNVPKHLQVIARRSLGLVQALERGQYRFRLLAIGEVITACRTRNALLEARNRPGSYSPLFSYDPIRLLAAYLNTAKRVVQLRALLGNDTLLRERLELVFDGMSVSWQDFYHEEERFLSAYRWVGQTAVPFPIALVGRVSTVQAIQRRGRLLYVIKLKSSAAVRYSRDETVGEITQATYGLANFNGWSR
ncbi:hypothetical protein BHUM_01071 [Candidatus Burkholderia humilis]|nr:hypothetical protein BHUM_01071 [Candidatus Burkholderia humilis]